MDGKIYSDGQKLLTFSKAMIHSFENLTNAFNSKYDIDSTRPVIGLAGFFGYGNYGDELFLEVWARLLSADYNLRILHDLEFKPYFSDTFSNSLESVDGILIGGGDILQPWNIDPRYWNQLYFSKPVWIAGIGVPIRANSEQAEKPWKMQKLAKWLQSDSVKYIHSRDPVSHEWLKQRFELGDRLHTSPDLVCALKESHFNKIETEGKSLGIVVRSRPGKELTDDFSNIENFARNSFDRGWQINVIVLGTGRTLLADIESSLRLNFSHPAKYFYSNNIDFITNYIMRQDALLSMKFHGTVAASMAGIPSVVGVNTLKNIEFCKMIGESEKCIGFLSEKLSTMSADDLTPLSMSKISNVSSRVIRELNVLKSSIDSILR